MFIPCQSPTKSGQFISIKVSGTLFTVCKV
jgi:hypothetical protein